MRGNKNPEEGLAIPRTEGSALGTTSAAVPEGSALAAYRVLTGPQTTEELVLSLTQSAGNLQLTEEQRAILFAPVDPNLVEIRPDGPIYYPAGEYRDRLCKAFGLEWTLLPSEPEPKREGKTILWGFYLIIQGVPMGFAWGGQDYEKGSYRMSYDDAMEGAKSNALMRLCKGINMCMELWRPGFGREWRAQHAESYVVQSERNQGKTQWRRKEASFRDPPSTEGSGVQPPTAGDTISEEAEEAATDETASQASPEGTTSNGAPKDINFWRRKTFQHAKDLGMPEDEITAIAKEHFTLRDPETGKTVVEQNNMPVKVTEKKQLTIYQWEKLANGLYDKWVAAGRPKAPEKEKPKSEEAKEKETEAGKEAEADAAPGPFPPDATVVVMMGIVALALEVDILPMRRYLEFQYMANIEALSEMEEVAVKELLTKMATAPELTEHVKKSLQQWAQWEEGITEEQSDIDDMVAALAAKSPELKQAFLDRLKIDKLKDLTQEQFGGWRDTLEEVTAHALENEEKARSGTEEPEKDADDDILF